MASQFSAFAPSGIRFTSRKPKAESYYETIRASWGSLFSDDPNSEANIDAFATAKLFGIASEMLERAGNQANPRCVNELISKLEKDYEISPKAGATLAERRAELIAAKSVNNGDFVYAIRDALRLLIGAQLLAVVPQRLPDSFGGGGRFPDSLSATTAGPGNFKSLGDSFKSIICNNYVMADTRTVSYTHVYGNPEPIKVGDVIVIDPDSNGLVEKVVVTAVGDGTFTATFTKAHSTNAKATTAAFPYWITASRFLYVVVADSVFASNELMYLLNKFLNRTLCHAARWGIVRSSGTGTTGAFTIGSSIIGQSTIAEVTY